MDNAFCYTMRAECAVCGSTLGKIETKNGQDCVICECGRFQYNAPKHETGRGIRSVNRTPIKPSKRHRVIERALGRCEICGVPVSQTVSGLHVGHIISITDGVAAGISEEILNSESNLIAECDECNLGHKNTISLQMYINILRARGDV